MRGLRNGGVEIVAAIHTAHAHGGSGVGGLDKDGVAAQVGGNALAHGSLLLLVVGSVEPQVARLPIPAEASSVWETALSMHTAEASAAQPTNGMPESCKSPCTVPSSPFFAVQRGDHRVQAQGVAGSGQEQAVHGAVRGEERLPVGGVLFPGPLFDLFGEASVKNQAPSLVMPTATGS